MLVVDDHTSRFDLPAMQEKARRRVGESTLGGMARVRKAFTELFDGKLVGEVSDLPRDAWVGR